MGIRAAREEDLQAVLDIYNHAVENTTATFDTELRSMETQAAWFTAHLSPYAAVVYEDEGKVLGWGSVSEYSPRLAYRFSGEVSVYVRNDSRHRGLGEALLRELISTAASSGLHTLIGRVCRENEASCRLAEKTGFHCTGVLEEVGYKFGRWLDVAFYQLRLDG